MTDRPTRLLLIGRDLLTGDSDPESDLGLRALATLNRGGVHLLLTAPQPDQWTPTRGTVDEALTAQTALQQRLKDFGAEFDGVYYVARSLFSQDRNRRGALENILQRYGLAPEDAMVLSSSRRFAATAEKMGIPARATRPETLRDTLMAAVTPPSDR